MNSTNVESIDNDSSPYGYIPTQSIAIVFLVLFSVSTIAHTGQATYSRMWWLLPTVTFCGILEILGWAARVWSSISPLQDTPFTIQITATIIGPTPLLAANFVILGKIIEHLGPAYSRLSPKWYAIVFCTGDVVSLVIQAIGGGIASSASENNEDPTLGGNIILAGISIQMAMISLYALCAIEFFVRYLKYAPVRQLSFAVGVSSPVRGFLDKHMCWMCIALMFSTICLFIRAVYRTIELSDGWDGRIISTQVYFNVLDGAMIVLAMYTLNFGHPAYLLDASRRRDGGKPVTSIEMKDGVKGTESMQALA
ncbi:Uncharacterized protein C17G6.02c [Hypsizygus marmoreus]|uniref:Uncharacterized protein C17G6.02c n=1 Tax=Hypsizygus marmoreus TaxID=39966 RepID=A0A369K3N3_HYPMA|nr:Uncharacterized protein C17G6.02c [Hypsizygus marmoreus]